MRVVYVLVRYVVYIDASLSIGRPIEPLHPWNASCASSRTDRNKDVRQEEPHTPQLLGYIICHAVIMANTDM